MKKLAVLLLVLAVLIPTALAEEAVPAPVELGQEASDFSVELLDGTTFTLSENRGKVVYVNVWATWCPPCVAEMPAIEQLSVDYADQLVVIGLNSGEDARTVADFVEKNGYTYNFALDESYELINGMFPTDGIPYSVIIDPNGVVTTLHVGGGSDMYPVLQGYVEAALANAAAVPEENAA